MKINLTLKDKITARVTMNGYKEKDHQKMLDLLHQINERHKKDGEMEENENE